MVNVNWSIFIISSMDIIYLSDLSSNEFMIGENTDYNFYLMIKINLKTINYSQHSILLPFVVLIFDRVNWSIIPRTFGMVFPC